MGGSVLLNYSVITVQIYDWSSFIFSNSRDSTIRHSMGELTFYSTPNGLHCTKQYTLTLIFTVESESFNKCTYSFGSTQGQTSTVRSTKGQNQVCHSFYQEFQKYKHEKSKLLYWHKLLFVVVRYGIDRNKIVLGRTLGEGFFGEVYDGVYKKSVSTPDQSKWSSILGPKYEPNICV